MKRCKGNIAKRAVDRPHERGCMHRIQILAQARRKDNPVQFLCQRHRIGGWILEPLPELEDLLVQIGFALRPRYPSSRAAPAQPGDNIQAPYPFVPGHNRPRRCLPVPGLPLHAPVLRGISSKLQDSEGAIRAVIADHLSAQGRRENGAREPHPGSYGAYPKH